MAALCLNCFRIPTDVFILSDAVFPGGEAPFSAYICRPECLHRSAELYFLPFVFGVDGLLFAVDGSFIERGRCPAEYVVGTFRRSGNLSGGTDGLGLAAGKAYRQGGPSSMDGPVHNLRSPARPVCGVCYCYFRAAWAAASHAMGTRNGEQDT